MIARSPLCMLIVLMTAGTLLAEDTYRVVPDGSHVTFAGKSTIHDFTGTAVVAKGAFRLAAADAAGFIVVDATTMDTRDHDRDAQMHQEVMESATYPSIRFDVRRFTPSGDGGTVQGTWTMHGVTRDLAVPVTLNAGEHPRLTGTIIIDIRQWRIRPPSKLLVITVDPVITVSIDLALAIDAHAEIPPAPARTLSGLMLSDQIGGQHQVGSESPGRLAMVFDIEQRSLAKTWDDGLSEHLPKDRGLVRLLDGSAIKVEDRPRLTARIAKALDGTGVLFLLDWDGAVRKRLALPSDRVWIVSFDATGSVSTESDEQPNAAGLTTSLKAVGIVPDPPLRDDAQNQRGRRSP
jgi:polyisoprenoid-binding protein YceI